MKKAFIVFIAFTLSATAFAQEMTCLDKLLPFNRYSGLHQLVKEEWTDAKEGLDAESARTAVTFLANSKLLCKTNEMVIKIDPVCTQTVADLPQSVSCFIFTNLGYFVATRDLGRNVNFIFSKDRRFAEPKPL